MRTTLKSNLQAALAILLGFCLGAVTVGVATVGIGPDVLEQATRRRASEEAVKAICALDALRHDDRGAAIEMLEWQLDDGLIDMAAVVQFGGGPHALNPAERSVIRRAGEYRRAFPRSTDYPHTDETVAAILAVCPAPDPDAPPSPALR